MPTYHIFFDDHTGTTTLIQVWAETREQAILKAKGQAIYIGSFSPSQSTRSQVSSCIH